MFFSTNKKEPAKKKWVHPEAPENCPSELTEEDIWERIEFLWNDFLSRPNATAVWEKEENLVGLATSLDGLKLMRKVSTLYGLGETLTVLMKEKKLDQATTMLTAFIAGIRVGNALAREEGK